MEKIYRFFAGIILSVCLLTNVQAQTISKPILLGTTQSFLNDIQFQVQNSSTTQGRISQRVASGQQFAFKVNYQKSGEQSALLMGEVSDEAGSSFMINATSQSLDGHVIFTTSKKAYKYFSDEKGNAYLAEVDINTLVCIDYENKPTSTQKTDKQAREAAVIAPALLNLQSLPGAAGCVLLDFDGYYMPAGNYWNNGNAIDAAPSGMSDADVQQHFDVVAEDFRPFNVNITTSESVFNSYPRNRRMRVVITNTNTAAPGAGGVAYIGSFNWDNDVPCWVFITSGKSGGDASSHEIGHCFDLQHDGRSNPDEGYFLGIDGTSWAPIMGAGYYRPVVQWSKGEYRYAKNDQPGVLQDDIATVASSKFGIGFRADDYANNIGGAATIDYNSGGAINQKAGVIGNEADWDFFTFTTGGGNVNINANTVSRDGNLHVIIRLYNSSGAEIGNYWNQDPFALNASMNVNLAAGKYYISIDGTGAGDPAYGGYSAYGSLGSYWITGTIPPGGTVNSTTGLVTVYKHCPFDGFSAGLDVGDYTLAQLQAKGVLDNDISSIRVTQGYKIIVFDGDNFTGNSITITSDVSCFGSDWNDKATSVQVRPNGDQTLSGIYVIQNRHSNLALDVNGGTAATGDNAILIQSGVHQNTNQQFRFEHLGDGTYKITAVHSGKAIDVLGISKDNGAAIVQWTYNGSPNQQWIAVPTGDGFYKLIAKHSGKLIEIGNFSTTGGAAAQQWTNENQTSGQWKIARPTPVNGTGDGLAGSYFNGKNFETPKFARKDNVVNAEWGTGSPDASVSNDNFSVRWTGQVQPRYYGTYTFYITNDDGGRLWVDNQLVVDKWRDDGGTEVSGTITLNAGQKYDIKVEYYEAGGGAKAKLEWSSPIQAREVVPTAQLYANPTPVVSITAPANNATVYTPANITVSANATDNGSVVKVDFYNGTTLLGSDNTAPYSYALTNVAVGTYSYKVIAFDDKGAFSISDVANVTVANDPLAGNGDGLTGNYFNGMNFESLVYSRKDANLNIGWGNGTPNAAVNVDQFSARWTGQVQPKYTGTYTFYINSDNGRRVWVNNQLIVDQWVDNWNVEYSGTIDLTAGQKYDIKVEYFENNGGASIKLEWASAQQTREVIPTSQLYSNPLPTVSVVSSATTAIAPANLTLNATASDVDGTITKVDFYSGSTLLGTDNSAPYSFAWNNVAVGNYVVTALATDSKGGVALSSAVNVNVNSGVNTPPSVNITAPTSGANFNAPAAINITASASDANGTVSKVDFYNGSTLLFSDNAAPYSYSWTGVGAGSYSITAKATDNEGAVTTSSAVSVVVNAVPNTPPTVNITAPTSGTSYTAAATINITANAADANGTVSKVDFYNGSTLLFSDNSAPYSYSWSGVAAGNYTLTARATDNDGATTISASVSVVVNAANLCSNIAAYAEGFEYAPGAKVQNGGKIYECKPWPYSGWCKGAAWAYGPGVGQYWGDAWTLVGNCTARIAAAQFNSVASPNPTTGSLNIKVENASTVTVVNTFGEVLMSEVQISSEGTIDLSALPNGIYMLKIDNGVEVIMEKIVKN